MAMLVLTPEDFDALVTERDSGSTSRPKGDLRKRLMAWARGLHKRLERQELLLVPVGLTEQLAGRACESVALVRVDGDVDPSSSRPVANVEASRAPRPDFRVARTRHAALILRVDGVSVEVGFEIHAAAREELAHLLALLSTEAPSSADDLIDAVRGLPEQFYLRVGQDSAGHCNDVTVQGLRALCSRARRERKSIWVGWSLPREVVEQNREIVGEQLGDALVALAPVYLLATPPDGDWAKARSSPAHSIRARARSTPRRAAPRLSRSGSRPGRTPAALRRAADPSPATEGSAFVEGMRVRVTAGAFADKTGVVTGVDNRGVRVLLGLLATRFTHGDLEPLADDKARPTLSSSHRRAAPSRKLR